MDRAMARPRWSNLPSCLFFLILDELLELIDCVRFSVVCKEWYSIAKQYYQTTQRWRQNTTLPKLLFPSYNKDEHVLSCSLYSISDTRFCVNDVHQLPIYHARPCLPVIVPGSCGWVAAIEEVQNTICLFHPLKKSVPPIHIPFSKDPQVLRRIIFITKIELSADPALNPDTCVVTVCLDLHDECYIMMKQNVGGGEDWTCISKISKRAPVYLDILIYNSQLYCIGDQNGKIVSYDVVSTSSNNSSNSSHRYAPTVRALPSRFCSCCNFNKSYLLESKTGVLWHVVRRKKIHLSPCEIDYRSGDDGGNGGGEDDDGDDGHGSKDGDDGHGSKDGDYGRGSKDDDDGSNYEDDGSNDDDDSSNDDDGTDDDTGEDTFCIFKVPSDSEDARKSWQGIFWQVEVESIGDEAIFLGQHDSVSVLASQVPGCRPNSIYYIARHGLGSYLKIFNLEDRSTTHVSDISGEFYVPPVWIVPPFRGLGA